MAETRAGAHRHRLHALLRHHPHVQANGNTLARGPARPRAQPYRGIDIIDNKTLFTDCSQRSRSLRPFATS